MKSEGHSLSTSIIKKLQGFQEFEQDVIKSFLNKTFDDLCKRENTMKCEISEDIFVNYLELPQIISYKIFNSFDRINIKTLSSEEFIEGMFSLYFSSNYIVSSVFRILYNNQKLKIYKEEVFLLFSYLNNSDFLIQNINNFIDDFFSGNYEMTLDEFNKKIENEDSDLFFIFLILLFNKKPFSEEVIEFYKENCIKENNSSFEINNNNKYILISNPSNKVIHYLKQSGLGFTIPERKCGSKIISNFEMKNPSKKNEQNLIKSTNGVDLCSSYDFSSGFLPEKISKENFIFLNRPDILSNFFSTYAYKISSDNSFKKHKLILIKKDLFAFKYSNTKDEFIFDRVFPLSGYHITHCDSTIINDTEFYPLALISKYGNSKANLCNIFFYKSIINAEYCTEKIKEALSIRTKQNPYKFKKRLERVNMVKYFMQLI